MIKATILEIDGRPGQDAKVTFCSGSSTVVQTLFAPWDDINTLEPGGSYPLNFGARLPDAAPATPAAEPTTGSNETGNTGSDETEGETGSDEEAGH